MLATMSLKWNRVTFLSIKNNASRKLKLCKNYSLCMLYFNLPLLITQLYIHTSHAVFIKIPELQHTYLHIFDYLLSFIIVLTDSTC